MAKSERRRVALVALVAAGAILVGGASALSQSKGNDATLTGTVSDSMCGAKHPDGPSAADCTRSCVSSLGSQYVLVVGDKVYKLEGNTEGLERLAGAKAKVNGTVDNDTVDVSSVSPN
jgi:hypothetical protein